MYIAYVSSPAGIKINQIHNITDLKVDNKLNDVGSASFSIGITNQANNYETLQEFNQIEIYEQTPSGEKKMIEGVIKNVIAGNNLTTVYIGDYNYFFKSKFIYSSKNYTAKSPEYILSEILLEINTRFDTQITLDCGIDAILPNKTYNEGSDFLTILKDLAEDGYEFIVENKILKFKEYIGVDRTLSGDDYIEYNYDKDNLDSRTIQNPVSEYNADNICNYAKVKDGSTVTNTNDPTSITKYGSVERTFNSSGGDNQTADEILNERKNSVKEIKFTPISKDFFEVGIGDTVSIYIISQNPLNQYIGSAKIIEKSYKSGNLSSVNTKVSISKVKTLSFLEKIQSIDSRLKTLEI